MLEEDRQVSAELERLRSRLLELEARAPGGRGAAPHRADSFGLEAREQLLSEAERIAHVGSFVWHLPTDSIYWSDEMYRILGYAPGEITPSQEAWFCAVHPSDLPLMREARLRGVSLASSQTVEPIGPIEFRVVRPNGEVRHVRLQTAGLQDASGRPTRFVGAVLDLTERVQAETGLRQSEQALRSAQRIAQLGSFEWEPWSETMTWSEELYRICGIPRSEPASLERFLGRVHAEDRARLRSVMADTRSDPLVPPLEYRLVRDDGTTIDVYAEIVPVPREVGRRAGFVGTVMDITQRKRLEAQLLQSQKMEALGRLAGGVAHDFNNLLTLIGVHVELLRRRRDDAELGAVAGAVERAAALTRQLLTFTRQAVFEPRRIDPADAVGSSLRMVRRIVGEDVRVVFRPADDVGMLEVDPVQLEQVLLNLVVNARDAMPHGGNITVGLERIELAAPLGHTQPPLAPGSYVVLSVRDDGSGMDAAVRSRALEPFFTTKEPGRGTGLGLAMVFGIASQSGGAVALDSAKGVGTEVRVYLPRAAGPQPLQPARPASAAPRAGRDELVLLVDDDPRLRELLGEVLVAAGYRVKVVGDGAAALAFVAEQTAELSLVVTDVIMPLMRGPELVRRLRERWPELPALYLSGYAKEHASDVDSGTQGAFLMKPFSPDALVRRVGELVAARA